MPKKLQPTDSTFSKRLTKLRKIRGLTQAQLGNAVDVSQRVIAYYENETDNIPANLLPKLAAALKRRSIEMIYLRKPESELCTRIGEELCKLLISPAAVTVGNVAGLLPSNSGLGLRDVTINVILDAANIPNGATTAIIFSAILISFNLLAGLFFIFDFGKKKKENLSRIQE